MGQRSFNFGLNFVGKGVSTIADLFNLHPHLLEFRCGMYEPNKVKEHKKLFPGFYDKRA